MHCIGKPHPDEGDVDDLSVHLSNHLDGNE